MSQTELQFWSLCRSKSRSEPHSVARLLTHTWRDRRAYAQWQIHSFSSHIFGSETAGTTNSHHYPCAAAPPACQLICMRLSKRSSGSLRPQTWNGGHKRGLKLHISLIGRWPIKSFSSAEKQLSPLIRQRAKQIDVGLFWCGLKGAILLSNSTCAAVNATYNMFFQTGSSLLCIQVSF